MRLIKAHIKGYGRLADAKVNLDSKVIAVVGPNEAGKTTFLKALAYLDSSGELPPAERSRAMDVPGETTVIRVKFAVEDGDRDAVSHLDLETAPQVAYASRTADGDGVSLSAEPTPQKRVGPLRKAFAVLTKATTRKSLQTLLSGEGDYGVGAAGGGRDYRNDLTEYAGRIKPIVEGEAVDHDEELELVELGDELSAALVPEKKAAKSLRDALSASREWLSRSQPQEELGRLLWRRTPSFLLFDDADRTLRSTYTLDESLLENVPTALANLSRMAELDLAALLLAEQSGDIARRNTALAKANNTLSGQFRDAWKQSALSVRLEVDGAVLRVLVIENGEDVTVFDERSAGLRMFIALVAFLSTRDTEFPPVLLIDEAENHLHIDAQADLVNMFISQEQAARVIYTTHSPACLPPDLGVGVRAVIPSSANYQASEVRNHFWSDRAGFSPLMIAMGAAAAAFTPARFVVLAEGATEMIMLPSLVRAATGLDTLPYQVAPGLSEVPRDFYASLDLEGAKVAYLLDGDAQGNLTKKHLVKSGVPEQRIVLLPVPGLENLLAPSVYSDAVLSVLRERLGALPPGRPPRLGPAQKGSWSKQFQRWADEKGLSLPSKVAVATRIVESGHAFPAPEYANKLANLHASLIVALEAQNDGQA